jgi:GxxExxY protein
MDSSEGTGTATRLRYVELTEQIIGAAIEVHRAVGPGLLEGIYEECLCHELALRKLGFERQLVVPVVYKGMKLECKYRVDVLVEATVVLELKTVERVLPIHEAQLLTYLRLLSKPVGLILNFNVPAMRHGIVRRVL